ncbi:hypothetical protein CFOL_v3_07962 [Cephalotus follicularis]|uniref:PPR domain-containing protein n=1 Tax=Cephalotus follicularis TaxID=3775 RepID=A0A1Q3B9B6_CEPFO|nr:hypothetical protein CFOL_v3_07962 [Cephalotus follicularis]
MATSYSYTTNLNSLTTLHTLKPKTSISTTHTPIRCGPRDNRGPLVKGRVLSIEAIQAVQSLKRTHKQDPTNTTHFPSLSRLIKHDLLAVLRELLRQDFCTLALHAFSTLRSEYPPVDLSLYSDVVSALARNGLMDDIDRLICGLESEEGIVWGEDKGLVRLIKVVIGEDRKESTVRICGLMRKDGCGSTWRADDYVVKVLSKGLRRFGEAGLADEVEREFGWARKGSFDKVEV